MSGQSENLKGLVGEYQVLAHEAGIRGPRDEIDWSLVARRLESDCDWTARGASELVSLVQDYGSFVLRNAAALALVLEIEDGAKGL